MLSSTKSFSTCAQPAFVSRCIPLISPAPSSSLRQTRLVTCPMSSADSKLTFDAAQSASYDEVVVKPLAGPFFDVLRRLSSPAVGDACLDVATGTGPVAFRVASLIGSTGSVLGVDFSKEMLSIAAENAKLTENESTSSIISWMHADACAMSLPDNTFDRAYCREGLQFMPDATAACTLVRKALKPGGTFTASCKAPAGKESNPMFAAFKAGMLSIGKNEWAAMLDMPTCWAETDAAGVARFETCFGGAGFKNVTVVIEDVPCSLPSIDRVFAIVTALPFGDELVGDTDMFESFKSSVHEALVSYVDQSTGCVALPVRALFAQGVSP